jgi:hypothetical protein
MDVTPETIIKDFADNPSCESWQRDGRDKAKEHLINYFVAWLWAAALQRRKYSMHV